jgi:hypothetical protein
MKTLLVGALVAGGAALALRRLAPRLHKLHSHCREMMQNPAVPNCTGTAAPSGTGLGPKRASASGTFEGCSAVSRRRLSPFGGRPG